MKIIFVLENYYPHLGGAEVLFKNLCEGLAEKHNVIVITHRLPNTEEYEIINKVRVYRINVPKFASRYFFTFMCIPKLFSICKDADIINTTTYNGAPPTWLAGYVYDIPTVITILEVIGKRWTTLLNMNHLTAKIHQILEYIIVNLSFSKHVCISDATMNDLYKVNKKADMIKIYPGIDYNHWNPDKYKDNIRKKYNLNNKFVYLFYGRPGPSKGFTHLLKAVKYIKKNIPNSILFAILSNNLQYQKYFSEINSIIHHDCIVNDVIIHAPVHYDILPEYIKMADCVVVPSVSEGFGYTTVESCTMKKPVVVSYAGSIPEVVFGKYVFSTVGKEESIANGIQKIKYKDYMIKNDKIFLWKTCIENYEQLYNELINE